MHDPFASRLAHGREGQVSRRAEPAPGETAIWVVGDVQSAQSTSTTLRSPPARSANKNIHSKESKEKTMRRLVPDNTASHASQLVQLRRESRPASRAHKKRKQHRG